MGIRDRGWGREHLLGCGGSGAQAGGAAGIELGSFGINGDDARTSPSGQHYLVQAKAATGTENSDRFTRLDSGATIDFVGRRDGITDDPNFCRMVFVVETVWQLDEIPGGQFDKFRIAPVAFATHISTRVWAKRFKSVSATFAFTAVKIVIGCDGVADGKALDIFPYLCDLRGYFVTNDPRKC